jgi:hypothetical protein
MPSKTPFWDRLFGKPSVKLNEKLSFAPDENLQKVIVVHGQQLERMRSGTAYKDTPVETTDTSVDVRWEYETQVGRTVDWVATYRKYPERNPTYDAFSYCHHDTGVDMFLTREKAIKCAKDGNSSTGRIRSIRVETKMDFHEPYSVV